MTEETKEVNAGQSNRQNNQRDNPRELIAPGTKAVQDAINKSIQARASGDGDYGIGGLGLGGLLTYMTNAGELVSPWWSTQRDIDLRRFVKGSDHLSGTTALLTSKVINVPFRVEPRDYSLKSHIRQADEYQRILVEESEFGQGWITLGSKILDDWFSTDNGLFMEICGDGKKDGPIKGPAQGIAALDSTRIIRKRDPEFPIGYIDEDGSQYKLHYTRVAYASDQPSNVVEMRGVGFCSVSRCINVTQRLVDMALFFQEKLGSRPLRAVMFTPGIPTDVVEATLRMSAEILDNQALRRFSTIPVLGGNDTNARFELIPLSTLPDGFDEETSTRLCMFAQALAFGVPIRWIWPAATSGATKADAMYQHIAGLGGGIGRILKALTLILGGDPNGRRHTVGKFLPPHLKLVFDFQDDEQDRQKAEIKKIRTDTSVEALGAGIITLRVAREQALEAGDLTQAQFDAMELADGRLPSGEDIMTLFYVMDDVTKAMLDLGVSDPLNVAANDREKMIEAIEEKQAEVRQFLGTASSVSRKQTAKQALAALGKLREAYEQRQSAQQQADDSETEEQAEGRDQPDNVDEENVDEKRPSESSESSDMNDADQGNEQEEEETEDEMKVWDSISDVPSHLTSMNGAKLTLSQINHLARIADAIEEGGQVENAWAVARNQFKKIYKKDGDKWVRREKKKGIVGRIIDGIKGDGIKGGPGSGNWGHAGRPGERGGSSPGKAVHVSLLGKSQRSGNPRELRSNLEEEVNEWKGFAKRVAQNAASDGPYSDYLLEIRDDDGNLDVIGSADITQDGYLEITYLASRVPRSGRGSDAMRAFAEEALRLETIIKLMSSQDAIGFYEKLGLEMDDTYWGDEQDGVLYWWNQSDMIAFLEEKKAIDRIDKESYRMMEPESGIFTVGPSHAGSKTVTGEIYNKLSNGLKSLSLSIKQAAGASRYRKDIWGAVQNLWNGTINKSDFIGVLKKLIPLAFEQAWLDGASAAGIINIDELTDIEKLILKERIEEEKKYIRGFATYIAEHDKKAGYKLGQLKPRSAMWWNRYHDIVNQSRAMALGDKKLKWVYGDTMHCTSCLKLNGKVKRASQWVEAQIRPQHPDLACHGFKCECRFDETDEPMSKGKLPRIP